jgi:beta-lactamase regulating signal transducer with metallopeptidase domain
MMKAEALQALINTTLASSAAVLIVSGLRKPMRAAVGARTAYCLWILVPAMAAAVLLPVPSPLLVSAQVTLPEQIRAAFLVAAVDDSMSYQAVFLDLALATWAIGACAMLFSIFARQRSFLRSLGTLIRDEDGLHRSDFAVAPLLVGAWNSKIVVPRDFDLRYSPEERELMLAHERAHESRHDVASNMLASIALCLYWFNPLMYRALAWLRVDQELACDAVVLARRDNARGRYADTLLKAQLATQSRLRQPIGCHWQSIHPLTERISMLKRPLPGQPRRLAGLAFIIALTGIASYAAWAGQGVTEDSRLVLLDLKVTISNAQTHEVRALATQYLVRSGETIKDANDRPLDFACTPYLADEPGHPTNWSDQKKRAIPLPLEGQILVDCTIRRDGEILGTPAVIVGDGKLATIETAEHGGPYRYRFEITASTSAEKISAATKQSGPK